ncbi:MAG: D-alanyl-D-alanine carboxypeptidase [Acidiferrobacterales bacterium]|nr:D-alanyl-D-alanine carboxypeptidase [Acidiferrobacterales bacterium]
MPRIITALFCLCQSLLLLHPAHLHASPLTPIPDSVKSVVPTPDIDAKSWMLVDFESGWILGEENKDLRVEPASLTKLMTSYLVFEALKEGEIKLTDKVYVSEKAWKTGGSRMFVQVDSHVDVESLLKGLIIQSGNDAAVALAEHLGGSEEGFAVRMNHKAAELGMVNSHFTNSNGLPDPDHYSTAGDIIILGRSLIRRFPDLFTLYSTREYTYNEITQKNRNSLLWRDPSVDGLKTGYTKAAGYCLVGTAKRDDMRLMAIVTGTESRKERADSVQALLQYGYAAYDGLLLYQPGADVSKVPLWMGKQADAGVGVPKPLGLVYPKGQRDKLSAALNIPESLEAPLEAGKDVGSIVLKYDGKPLLEQRLLINADHPEGPWWSQLIDSVKRLF